MTTASLLFSSSAPWLEVPKAREAALEQDFKRVSERIAEETQAEIARDKLEGWLREQDELEEWRLGNLSSVTHTTRSIQHDQ